MSLSCLVGWRCLRALALCKSALSKNQALLFELKCSAELYAHVLQHTVHACVAVSRQVHLRHVHLHFDETKCIHVKYMVVCTNANSTKMQHGLHSVQTAFTKRLQTVQTLALRKAAP